MVGVIYIWEKEKKIAIYNKAVLITYGIFENYDINHLEEILDFTKDINKKDVSIKTVHGCKLEEIYLNCIGNLLSKK